MKDCNDCDYFRGRDRDDSTPICDYESGYNRCPCNDETDCKLNEAKLEIDMTNLLERIAHRVENTVRSEVYKMAHDEIVLLARKTYDKSFKCFTQEEIQKQISEAVEAFITKSITIGVNWREAPRGPSIEQYLDEHVKRKLERKQKTLFDAK